MFTVKPHQVIVGVLLLEFQSLSLFSGSGVSPDTGLMARSPWDWLTAQLLRNRVWRQPCTHLTTEWGWVSGWPCGEMWTVSAKHQVFWGQTGWNTDRETNQTRATKQFFLGSFWPILAAYKLLIIQRKLMAWSEKQNPGKTCSNIKPLVW